MRGDALEEGFRAALARRPAGIAVLGVRAGGHPLLVPVTDVASASLRPPMVTVSVYADSRAAEALEDAPEWGLSVLDGSTEAGAALARVAEPGRPLVGQAVGIELVERAGDAVLLEAASAHLVLRTSWTRLAGDHVVVAADVLEARATGRPGAHVHALGRARPWSPPGQG
ncbi:flavin reductase family protein [Georgenia sp. Z1344]|uniref:flavin reductase family protein n=1 Tax=Georgenia sp. Z1344 TaxID=3416706 RepID=UPI003CEAC87D